MSDHIIELCGYMFAMAVVALMFVVFPVAALMLVAKLLFF